VAAHCPSKTLQHAIRAAEVVAGWGAHRPWALVHQRCTCAAGFPSVPT